MVVIGPHKSRGGGVDGLGLEMVMVSGDHECGGGQLSGGRRAVAVRLSRWLSIA